MAPCAKCGQPSSLCCSKCKDTFYCSRDHQKDDWNAHKANGCIPFKVGHSEKCGRYLVASRFIPAGHVIYREMPLVAGPKLLTKPMCLGCYRPVVPSAYRCSRCKWPMCSLDCESSAFHQESECVILSQHADRMKVYLENPTKWSHIYQMITPLRALLLKGSSIDKWNSINQLMSHAEERKGTELHQVIENNVVGFIRHFLGLQQFSADEIHEICTILDTNSFEVRIPSKSVKIRALYKTCSLLNHNCRPNTRHVFDDRLQIQLISTVDISKGESITATYTQSLWNTLSRRLHLKSSKHFWCDCERCQDASEFGTLFSAMKCLKCSAGYVVSLNPVQQDSPWRCQQCNHNLDSGVAKQRCESMRKELKLIGSQCDAQPQLLQDFISKYSAVYHQRNSYVVEAKFAFVQLYGNVPQLQYNDLTDELLQQKLDYCKELLAVADVLEPGLTQLRGQLLFELQNALVHFAKKLLRQGKSTAEEFQDNLSQGLVYLRQAMQVHRHEAQQLLSLRQQEAVIASLMLAVH